MYPWLLKQSLSIPLMNAPVELRKLLFYLAPAAVVAQAKPAVGSVIGDNTLKYEVGKNDEICIGSHANGPTDWLNIYVSLFYGGSNCKGG